MDSRATLGGLRPLHLVMRPNASPLESNRAGVQLRTNYEPESAGQCRNHCHRFLPASVVCCLCSYSAVVSHYHFYSSCFLLLLQVGHLSWLLVLGGEFGRYIIEIILLFST